MILLKCFITTLLDNNRQVHAVVNRTIQVKNAGRTKGSDLHRPTFALAPLSTHETATANAVLECSLGVTLSLPGFRSLTHNVGIGFPFNPVRCKVCSY